MKKTNSNIDRNSYIAKRHINAVIKFNNELNEFAKETEEDAALLYEDAFTSFTLANVRIEDGFLVYDYDGREEREEIVHYDEDEKEYYEEDIDGIAEWLKFYRACLRRAKRYWNTDTERLDKIQDGTIEDHDPEEE